jgi:rhodanese-related sulfurtransferase
MSFWTDVVDDTKLCSLICFRFGPRLRMRRLHLCLKAGASMLIIFPLVVLLGVVSTATLAHAAKLIDGTVNDDPDEVSTNYLKGALPDLCDPTNPQNEFLFDARPSAEYAMSHIPCARNVAQKPGTPTSEYISDACEIQRIVGENNKQARIILYCNGPFCGKSIRLGDDLVDPNNPCGGFTNVWRYQAGAPVWRALEDTAMQIEASAVKEVWFNDQTARIFDARDDTGRQTGGRIPGAIVLPIGDVSMAKEDGRLPMDDHNTRIICFGKDGEQAEKLADAIAHNAFDNVTFFNGTAEEFREAIFHETGPKGN